MELTSIQAYAQGCGVSYEAVRSQLRRFEKELQGHIIKQDGKRYLDETAVKFLNKHRSGAKIVVMDETTRTGLQQNMDEQAEQIRRLEEENKELLRRLDEKQEKIIALMEQAQSMIAEKAQAQLLLEQKDELQRDLEASREENRQAQQDLEQARAELQTYERTIFGLYRKKKQ